MQEYACGCCLNEIVTIETQWCKEEERWPQLKRVNKQRATQMIRLLNEADRTLDLEKKIQLTQKATSILERKIVVKYVETLKNKRCHDAPGCTTFKADVPIVYFTQHAITREFKREMGHFERPRDVSHFAVLILHEIGHVFDRMYERKYSIRGKRYEDAPDEYEETADCFAKLIIKHYKKINIS